MNHLQQAATEPLEQLRTIIQSIRAEGNIFEHYVQSGAGVHVRHILDYYHALQNGLSSGHIDYNSRRRGSAVESDPLVAVQIIDRLVLWDNIPDNQANRAVTIDSEISCEVTCPCTFESTAGREFLYIIDHSVHHIAHISLLLRQCNFKLDQRFGLAPGTASYLRDKETPVNAEANLCVQ